MERVDIGLIPPIPDFDMSRFEFYEEVGICIINPAVARLMMTRVPDLSDPYEAPDNEAKMWLARWARR